MSSCHCKRAYNASSPLSGKFLHLVHRHGGHRSFKRKAHASDRSAPKTIIVYGHNQHPMPASSPTAAAGAAMRSEEGNGGDLGGERGDA